MINSNIASKSYIINVVSIWENQNLAKVPIDEFGISFYFPKISLREMCDAKNDRDENRLKFQDFSAKVHPHRTLAVGLNWGDSKSEHKKKHHIRTYDPPNPVEDNHLVRMCRGGDA